MVGIWDIVRFEKREDRITAQLIATLEHSPKNKVLSKFLEKENGAISARHSVPAEIEEHKVILIPVAFCFPF